MAAAWLDADVQVLYRLAHMVEQHTREPHTALAAEIRQLEDRFGLSPMARRKLEWEIAHAGPAADEPPAPTGGRGGRKPKDSDTLLALVK